MTSFVNSVNAKKNKNLSDGRLFCARPRGIIFQKTMNLVGSFADFIAKNAFGQRGVSSPDCLNKRAKIFQALAIPFWRTVGVREAEAAPAPDAAVEDGKHGSERFAFCAFEEHFVEIVFRFEHGVCIAGVVGFFDDGESAFEARDLSLVSLFREQARGESFENGANGVDVAGFFDGERADNWSFIGDNCHKAFGFELAKGFADDGAGNAHHGDEFAFDEALAGIEAAGDDGLAKFVEDLAAEWRGGLGDGREDGRGTK